MKPDCLACVHCKLLYDQSKCDKFYIIPIDNCNGKYFESRFEKPVIDFQDHIHKVDEERRKELTRQIIENTKSF
jgi:hypothetical protein